MKNNEILLHKKHKLLPIGASANLQIKVLFEPIQQDVSIYLSISYANNYIPTAFQFELKKWKVLSVLCNTRMSLNFQFTHATSC